MLFFTKHQWREIKSYWWSVVYVKSASDLLSDSYSDKQSGYVAYCRKGSLMPDRPHSINALACIDIRIKWGDVTHGWLKETSNRMIYACMYLSAECHYFRYIIICMFVYLWFALCMLVTVWIFYICMEYTIVQYTNRLHQVEYGITQCNMLKSVCHFLSVMNNKEL